MTKNATDPTLYRCVQAAMLRKAIDLVVLDVRKLSDVTDYFLIASARSHRQVSAIAEFIERDLRKSGIRPIGVEGIKEGQWALLDYGSVVIHVFYEPVRQFYDIESLWSDAGRESAEAFMERAQQDTTLQAGKKCLLLILDGWGIAPPGEDNATWLAHTPYFDNLCTNYPNTRLGCAGKAVGLPEGVMGNSEVGHLNVGAGRIVYQVLLRIDLAIEDGSFFNNEALKGCMEEVRRNGSALHLMGLVSDAGVHSQLDHLLALIDMAKRENIENVYIHAILDGRDTPPDSGAGYVAHLADKIGEMGVGKIATICGRFYAMDRDTRWERTEKAYRLYTRGEGVVERDPVEAVKNAYARNETDEFVRPVAMNDSDGIPFTGIKDKDGIILFNFRPDRARQITRAFTEKNFDFFKRESLPALSSYVTMTQYDENFDLPVAFGPVHLDNILGGVISSHGLSQLRLAETEKYAHVTYFFNGGEETPFKNEDRVLIPSPRDIRTYDQKPEMSAFEVAEEAVRRIETGKYHLIVINFANLDMVGHTGIMEAAIKACEAVDKCVETVAGSAIENGYAVMVTADHGNSEKMKDIDKPHTAHTLNDVPFVLIDNAAGHVLRPGVLGDIAPTILEIMNIEKPAEMTGRSLIEKL
jgi:2,3-bisphosphoglycerate-independent phosphoglycerate mutase